MSAVFTRTGRDSVWMRAAVLLGTILLSGCLSRPGLVKESFTLSYPSASTTTLSTTNRVLGIRRLAIAAQFDDQSLVYRTGDLSYERDPYAEFLVPPAETFATAIRGYFRNSGLFSTVSEAGSARKPTLLVEIFIDQLYGDFRHQADSSAVLAMRFIFFDAPDGTPARVLAQKDYSRRINVKARTAASLIEGWNEALKQVMDEVCSDLKTNEHLP